MDVSTPGSQPAKSPSRRNQTVNISVGGSRALNPPDYAYIPGHSSAARRLRRTAPSHVSLPHCLLDCAPLAPDRAATLAQAFRGLTGRGSGAATLVGKICISLDADSISKIPAAPPVHPYRHECGACLRPQPVSHHYPPTGPDLGVEATTRARERVRPALSLAVTPLAPSSAQPQPRPSNALLCLPRRATRRGGLYVVMMEALMDT